jgi:hypothetical protein
MITTRYACANESDIKTAADAIKPRVRPSVRLWESDAFEGVVSDPMSLHKYLYASANPINATDPTGRFTILECTVTGQSLAASLG